MFGQWGSLILQFAITIAVVLVLVALVYWLVRRYSTGGLGRIGRGRVPRLAVIDAMAVDGRRRLVLIRRDNVEHLILVGGPSDLVVEQSIQRPRQRPVARPQAAPQPAPEATLAHEPPAETPPRPPDNPPIPFPHARAAPPAPATVAQGGDRLFFSSRRVAQPQMARVERTNPAPFDGVAQFETVAEAAPLFPDVLPAEAPPSEEARAPFPTYPENANGREPHLDFGETGRPASAESSPMVPAAGNAAATAAKVNDLEREMARLLEEITVKRTS
jgi:flagellar biogenesis protein FliO